MWDKNFKDRYILIEPTDKCNLDCVMCTRGLLNITKPHNRDLGDMDFELFVKIIDELEIGEEPVAIKLFWLGESLLNPNIKEMLYYCYERIKNTPAYIDLHTNALLLNDSLIDVLLLIGDKIPRITVSLDAVNPDTYSAIRRGGKFELAMKNIDTIIKKREANHLMYPSIIFQFIVQDENKNETKEFVDFWKDYLAKNLRKSVFDGFEQLPEDQQLRVLHEHNIYDEFMELKDGA